VVALGWARGFAHERVEARQLGEPLVQPHCIAADKRAGRFRITRKDLGGGVAADPALQVTNRGESGGALPVLRPGEAQVAAARPAVHRLSLRPQLPWSVNPAVM
jgi:hypothetical protein